MTKKQWVAAVGGGLLVLGWAGLCVYSFFHLLIRAMH